ncbi:hypothetical protein BGV60_02540 [Burkholderia ubonensis]|nr:hypothetical protein BGV60_02540 [Burkholderia ubonensis]
MIADTTVQEKAIAFPADSRLLRDIERKIAAAAESHQATLKTWLYHWLARLGQCPCCGRARQVLRL